MATAGITEHLSSKAAEDGKRGERMQRPEGHSCRACCVRRHTAQVHTQELAFSWWHDFGPSSSVPQFLLLLNGNNASTYIQLSATQWFCLVMFCFVFYR